LKKEYYNYIIKPHLKDYSVEYARILKNPKNDKAYTGRIYKMIWPFGK